MHLTIDPEFQSYIPPLSDSERTDLERSILAAGRALTPIDVWYGVIVDGHNRYAICSEHGLPFDTIDHDFADRNAAKSWIFENQITRRNLSVDQIVMLAAMRGVETKRGTALSRARAKDLAEANAPQIPQVVAGKWSLALAWGAWARKAGKLPPRTPRGPSGTSAAEPPPNIHDGHELRGQSTLIGPDGGLKTRWDKTGLAPTDEPAHDPIPEGHHIVSTSTMVDGSGATRVQWVRAEPEKAAREAAFWAAAEAHAAKVWPVPLPPIAAPEWTRDDLLAVYPLGDPHIGLLAWAPETGEHHDARIAERDLLGVVDMLVNAAPPAKEGMLVNLGDFLHAQSDEQRTPRAGHKLDVDGRRGKILELGLSLMHRLTVRLLEKHERVTVVNIPGNHDPDVAVMIALWLKASFAAEPRVQIEPAHSPYYYRRFGSCFFQISHGDGAKPERLAQIAAADRPEDWGATKFRYGHGGHVHSKHRIEFPGFRWESWNTLAAPDAWSHHAGYRSARELCVIGYHRDWGEIVRSTVDLAQARSLGAS